VVVIVVIVVIPVMATIVSFLIIMEVNWTRTLPAKAVRPTRKSPQAAPLTG
jgi:hypothetical protein